MERVAVFVDGSNLYHGLKNAFARADIDFLKLAQALAGDRQLVRIYYYNVPRRQEDDPRSYEEQLRFFENLRRTEYLTVNLGRLQKRHTKTTVKETCPKCGQPCEFTENVPTYTEKGVDVKLAVDMIRLARNNVFDTAVIVTEDADFVPAVHEVQEYGKHVESAYTRRAYHLPTECDRFVLLDRSFMEECFIRKAT